MTAGRLIDRRTTRLVVGVVGVAAALALWQVVGTSGSVTFLVPFSDACRRCGIC